MLVAGWTRAGEARFIGFNIMFWRAALAEAAVECIFCLVVGLVFCMRGVVVFGGGAMKAKVGVGGQHQAWGPGCRMGQTQWPQDQLGRHEAVLLNLDVFIAWRMLQKCCSGGVVGMQACVRVRSCVSLHAHVHA